MSCLLPPSCSFCIHYLGEDSTQNRECNAFFEIPEHIITGDFDHTEPYPGDHSIQFQLKEEVREDFKEVQKIREAMRLHTA